MTNPSTPAGTTQETGELYRLLVDTVADYAIFALDPNGFILSWNTGAQRLKGYLPDEIIGQHFSIFYPQETIDSGLPAHELKVAAKVGRFEDEGWRLRKDGSRFWANVVITALRNTTGTLVGYAKVTRDLTERRAAELALRDSEERFRLLVQGVRDYAIYMLDPQGFIRTWNEGAERIKGYTAAEIVGQHFSRFYTPEDLAAGKPAHELEVASAVGRYEEEGWRVRKDGTRFRANVILTPLRNDRGELVGFAKVTRDLTERLRAQDRALDDAREMAVEETARRAAEERALELRELAAQLQRQAGELETRGREADLARKRADDANRAKSEFLAAMSHELRTPLNAIGGYAQLMQLRLSGPLTDEQHAQLERIQRSQQHLLGIINDILNFSRIEAAQITYDVAPVPLRDVLEAVGQMIQPQAEAKALRFVTHPCPPDLVASADRAKVDQVLLNLLSNAVKFTAPGGEIVVCCSADRAAHRVLVEVRDSGVGIPADRLDAIFDPFVQVGRSLTNTLEGTGLGLSISRELARAMHGDVTVESTLGAGSTFRLSLPAD